VTESVIGDQRSGAAVLRWLIADR